MGEAVWDYLGIVMRSAAVHNCQVYLGLCRIDQTGATCFENALKLSPVRLLARLELPQDVHLLPNSAQSQTCYIMEGERCMYVYSTKDTLAFRYIFPEDTCISYTAFDCVRRFLSSPPCRARPKTLARGLLCNTVKDCSGSHLEAMKRAVAQAVRTHPPVAGYLLCHQACAILLQLIVILHAMPPWLRLLHAYSALMSAT